MGFRTLLWPWRGSRASGGNPRSSRTSGSREKKEVGRSLTGRRERGHFRSREVSWQRDQQAQRPRGREGGQAAEGGKSALLLRSFGT